ncbi:uncharacterized protein LOC130641224 [Hydractinia symbiolongicarpus]|uniref:uncharacterized protein LOC130641224 n=1 Tax=Hydractinia symbiolongicarpus TaxID=13093 RepID=UPI00254E6081|nr:uncharacterized protein LOC130641224 [Hydractinia symbiolongicarpus]
MESDHDIVSGDECPSDDSLYSPQLQIHIDDSYDENISEEESFDTAECNPGLKSDAQFLVFWSCLLTLFQVCFTCLQKTCITRVVKRGTLIIVTSICPNKHVFSWQSQPIVNGRAAGNLLLSAAILYSGNTYARIAEMMSILRLQFISKSTFYDGMIARTQLAVLDFNSGTNCEQAVTKKGVLRYKQVFSRVTQSWVVKKITEKKEKAYLAELMTATLEPIDNEKDKLPQTGEIAERITEVEKPDKSDAIKAIRTRFKT